jgi:glucose/arabinose dehydrogenase
VRIHFENGQPKAIEPFVSGFLTQESDGSWGRFARPFGLAVADDGSLLMGDEQNGIIYRIRPAQ